MLLPISNLSSANNRVKAVLSDSKQWTMAMVTGDAATVSPHATHLPRPISFLLLLLPPPPLPLLAPRVQLPHFLSP